MVGVAWEVSVMRAEMEMVSKKGRNIMKCKNMKESRKKY